MIIFGIDPGVSGAISILENKKVIEIFDMPTMIDGKKNKRQVNGSQVTNIIKERLKSEKEIIVVIHSFGSQGELYIFSIQNDKPTGSPEILQIPTTKPGTRPTQAQLINWDQQKKQEILLSCSSPERELLVLDYYNNKLSVITSLAIDFMTSTYGPIKLFTTDQNKDGVDDILIYSTKNQTEQYIFLSKEENKTKTLTENINFSSIKHLQKKGQTFSLLNDSNEIYSITNEKKIKTTTL